MEKGRFVDNLYRYDALTAAYGRTIGGVAARFDATGLSLRMYDLHVSIRETTRTRWKCELESAGGYPVVLKWFTSISGIYSRAERP